MDLLSPVNVLVKVVPKRPADSTGSWAFSRDRRSKTGKRRFLQTMFPMKIHHLSMATGLLTTIVLFLLAAFILNYDLCVHVSSDMEVIERYLRPSDRHSGFSQALAEIIAIFVILIAIICFFRWTSYPKISTGIQTFTDHVDAEAPYLRQIKCRTTFMKMISVEIENFIMYFFLMMLFAFFAAIDIHLPETIFWPKYSEEFLFLEDPTFCFIGFGIFGWLKPFIIAISGGFAVLCAVSVMNLYQHYLELKSNENISVAGITERGDDQNDAILLNARFSSLCDIQDLGDGSAPQHKATELIYVPEVKILNNSDTLASEMKTV